MVPFPPLSTSWSKRAITRGHAIALSLIVVAAAFAGWFLLTPVQFSMHATSRPIDPQGPGENVVSIVGQSVVFVVAVEDTSELLGGSVGRGQVVHISGSVPVDSAEIDVHPTFILPGEVAEVVVTPKRESVDETLTVNITGERLGIVRSASVDIDVIPGEDGLAPMAKEMRDKFVPWLALDHPALGIDENTQWTGTIVNPRILVVMHYIFFSEEWELYLTWHVTIAPNDWARIFLRHRSNETRASLAFEISSVSNNEQPESIQVPDWV